MTTEEEKVETLTLDAAANMAWAARAKLDEDRAVQSFRTQLRAKLKVKDAEIDPGMFAQNFDPHERVGAVIDGMEFKLDNSRALAVVAWRCSEKGCDSYNTVPVTDLVSLGRGLAMGDDFSVRKPKCQNHS